MTLVVVGKEIGMAKVTARNKVLPKQIAVAWDDGGSTDPDDMFLNAAENEQAHADDEWRKVGIYKLVETIEVRTSTEVKRRKG